MKTKILKFTYAKKEAAVLVRASEPEATSLFSLLFRRYPHSEWASFARFGWRNTAQGLVVTLASIDAPQAGEMDETVAHVKIYDPYTLRTALSAEEHGLAVGVIHSHPQSAGTSASFVDDDMDTYYAKYFAGFAPGRPYISLIFARNEAGKISATGRVFWQGQWHRVSHFFVEGHHVALSNYLSKPSRFTSEMKTRVSRLESTFGTEAADRLALSTVAVIGAGGTGSPTIEALARAGVGHIIVVDPDRFAASNFERVHGSELRDINKATPKVEIARRHVKRINPDCRVTAIRGSLPQPEVLDAVAWADIVLGCTDQQHSRIALSDLALRYLVPAFDCGVEMEGENGTISGQIIQLVRFRPADACVYCRKMITQRVVNQELMSEAEQAERQAAAADAEAKGESADPYWRKVPQLNTVGYLTMAAGGMLAGYAIGMLTGRFDAPFSRLQMNLSATFLDVTDDPVNPRQHCQCQKLRGMSDQAEAFITPPAHWPEAILLRP